MPPAQYNSSRRKRFHAWVHYYLPCKLDFAECPSFKPRFWDPAKVPHFYRILFSSRLCKPPSVQVPIRCCSCCLSTKTDYTPLSPSYCPDMILSVIISIFFVNTVWTSQWYWTAALTKLSDFYILLNCPRVPWHCDLQLKAAFSIGSDKSECQSFTNIIPYTVYKSGTHIKDWDSGRNSC